MQYRNFGKLDWKVSALGFGCMRLPVIGEDQSKINEPEAVRMIRYAIDNGVNYVDTAYPYHMGNSERVLGRALKDGYREKVKIATKLPVMMVQKAEDFDRFLNEQIERLQGYKIDFYLLHGLQKNGWEKVRDFGVLKWAEKQMAQGKFGRLGFSFHDKFPVFKEIVDSYDNWVLSQVQYNYMDVNNQAGRKGVEYAAGKGLAVVVMEPLRGGKLSKEPPPPVAKVWQSAHRKMTPAAWAFQWIWNQPEISVALSGMSTMEQVEQNVKTAGQSGPNTLSEKDLQLVAKVQKAYRGLTPVPCTDCKYCQPCPHGVDIPRCFQAYNDSTIYDDLTVGRRMYNAPFFKPENRADKCEECGECLEKCPQHIPIPDWLKKVNAAFKMDSPPPPHRPG
jgi:predicted aldo/keto reductase-like oxidoreductase